MVLKRANFFLYSVSTLNVEFMVAHQTPAWNKTKNVVREKAEETLEMELSGMRYKAFHCICVQFKGCTMLSVLTRKSFCIS